MRLVIYTDMVLGIWAFTQEWTAKLLQRGIIHDKNGRRSCPIGSPLSVSPLEAA
jgi:hypothetical protein